MKEMKHIYTTFPPFITPLPSKHCVDHNLTLSPSLIRRNYISAITSSIRMEPTQSPSEPEDFVHIEEDSKRTGDFSLSDSIVNVEKEDAVEEEEEHQDSDSVFTGGYAAAGCVIGGGDDDGEYWPARVELPEELAKSVVILKCLSNAESGSCDVYLIGTAHVSKESCREVKEIISFLKPEVVFVELCASRVSILQPQTVKIPTMSDMIESWKQKQNVFGILYGWFLAKIASKLEVFPGSEFRVAYEEALKYGGRVVLGDRPVQITLKRTWAKMPLRQKVKFLYSLMFQAVFLPSSEELDRMLKELDNVDMVTLVTQEMSKQFPSLMDTLVHERDQYMASSLLRVASEHNSVVAVIGRGHINGIKKNWEQPITMKDLMEIPRDDSVFTVKRIISSVAIAVIGTAIGTGLLFSRRR